jgi:hypothetical protein
MVPLFQFQSDSIKLQLKVWKERWFRDGVDHARDTYAGVLVMDDKHLVYKPFADFDDDYQPQEGASSTVGSPPTPSLSPPPTLTPRTKRIHSPRPSRIASPPVAPVGYAYGTPRNPNVGNPLLLPPYNPLEMMPLVATNNDKSYPVTSQGAPAWGTRNLPCHTSADPSFPDLYFSSPVDQSLLSFSHENQNTILYPINNAISSCSFPAPSPSSMYASSETTPFPQMYQYGTTGTNNGRERSGPFPQF